MVTKSIALSDDIKKQIYFNAAKIESLTDDISGLEAKVESTSSRLAKIEKVGYMIAGAFFLFNAGPGILDQANTLMQTRQQPQQQIHGMPHQAGHYGPWEQVEQTSAPAPVPAAVPANSTAIHMINANGNKVTYYAIREGDGPR